MVKIMSMFEVPDFAKWKPMFMESAKMMAGAGAMNTWLFQGSDNPKMVALVMDWENMDKAKAFMSSPELRAEMEKSGVYTKADGYVLQEIK
jgi:hypothetical protein